MSFNLGVWRGKFLLNLIPVIVMIFSKFIYFYLLKSMIEVYPKSNFILQIKCCKACRYMYILVYVIILYLYSVCWVAGLAAHPGNSESSELLESLNLISLKLMEFPILCLLGNSWFFMRRNCMDISWLFHVIIGCMTLGSEWKPFPRKKARWNLASLIYTFQF